jgi:hypothetical protein
MPELNSVITKQQKSDLGLCGFGATGGGEGEHSTR